MDGSAADHQITQPVRSWIFVEACRPDACREDAIKRLAMELGNLKGTNTQRANEDVGF